jgi:hypothetical protein
MRKLLAAIALGAACAASAQAPDVAWPREVKAADGTAITVYQPQIESWADNRVSARAAVAVMRPGEREAGYGVIELAARTAIDKSADVATLSELRITKSSFPGASEADAKRYLATLRGAAKRDSWPVSVQALQANLAITQARSKQKGVPVKNDPPDILFRTTPSLLVLVDGEPVLREAKGAPELRRVINTTALILVDASSTRYLWALGRWWQSKAAVGSEWEPAVSPPPGLEAVRQALAGQYEPYEGKDAEGKPLFDAGTTPRIIVATRPTELLQSKGEPQMSPIPGTQLLYMTSSRNDILFDLVGQAYYVLISGRWFSAKTMSGPWSYVPGKSLPPDFAKIPPDHSMGDLLISVPGTSQAREAAIANQIPQTATVQRDVQPTPVAYDGGEPQWKPIDGTKLSYAPNTAAPVIRVDPKSYYMVQNGVWFTAAAAAGPWTVATNVPAVIYGIPPSSPVHYVTYVRVYSSTPTAVVVGYTPGYYGTVMSTDGVVVYGTGYYYPAYVGVYWYPYPPTYGWGFGFTVGMYWGFAMGGGWYTPCCWSGGPHVVHYNNIHVDNSYNRWGGKSTSITGPGGRNVQATQVGNTTLAKGSGSNNVYAGRDGNVYRRDEGGQWQQYEGRGEGWSDVGNRPQQGRPEQLPAERPAERPQQRPAETPGSLDRQYQSRQAGDRAAQQYRQSGGAGFQGGGAYRGGGGGGRRR